MAEQTEVIYPLASSSWDEQEIIAMQKVIESGNFSMGEKVNVFEKAFSDFFGSKYAVMVNSGSSANLLMVAALFFVKEDPLVRGDEVIVPAVSWSTTYLPLQQYGLKLKFVDIDANTLNYDLNALERAATQNTKLIVLVNLLGNPNEFEVIRRIADKNGAVIIEDNCESMGAVYDNRFAGTFGKMGSYSTFYSHHISTMEGGVITTDDEELYHILLSLRAHGWTRNLPEANHVTGVKNSDPFYESFNFVLPGYNVRPLELSGAIGVEQLKKLPRLIEMRRDNGKHYQEQLGNHPLFNIQHEIGKSSWFGFALTLHDDVKIDRKELLERLALLGIQTRPIVTGDFTQQPVCKYFDYEIFEDLKNANRVHVQGLFIGNQHYSIKELFTKIRKI